MGVPIQPPRPIPAGSSVQAVKFPFCWLCLLTVSLRCLAALAQRTKGCREAAQSCRKVAAGSPTQAAPGIWVGDTAAGAWREGHGCAVCWRLYCVGEGCHVRKGQAGAEGCRGGVGSGLPHIVQLVTRR